MSELLHIATEQIHRHPLNPRRQVTDAKELEASIGQVGILSPLTVITNPEGGYFLIAGERRLTAARATKLDTVPAHLRDDLDEAAVVQALVVDNLQRVDLTPAEEATGYQALLDLGLSPETIAKRVGRTVDHVQQHAAANHLHPSAIDALHDHVVTLDQALRLADLDDMPDLRDATLDKLSQGGNPQQIVNDALRTRKHAKRVATAQEYARVLELPFLPASEFDYQKMDVLRSEESIEAHKGLTCHALMVGRYDTEAVEHVCTKVSAHKGRIASQAPTDDQDKAEQSEQRRRVLRNNKRFDEMKGIRREWLAQFTARSTPPKTYLPQIAALMVRHSPSEQLGQRARANDAASFEDLSTPKAAMVLIAAVVDEVESTLDKTLWRSANHYTALYLSTLGSWGYKLTDPEQAYINTVTEGGDPSLIDYTPQD